MVNEVDDRIDVEEAPVAAHHNEQDQCVHDDEEVVEWETVPAPQLVKTE